MSRSRGVLSIALAALLLAGMSGCGDEPWKARAIASPEGAWMNESNALELVRGGHERKLSMWEAFLWLPNGDLFVHTPSDGMAIYRPETGKLVAETEEEWGEDEVGLSAIEGHLTAADSLLRIERTEKRDHVVRYDFLLKELDSIELPRAPQNRIRDYSSPVRVGDTTFVAFVDRARDPELSRENVKGDGVLHIRDGEFSTIMAGRHVEALKLSSDATSVLALATKDRNGYPADLDNYGGASVIDLDPSSGKILAELGAPSAYSGSRWFIDRVDKVDGVTGVQIRVDCTDAGDGPPPACTPLRTWQHVGNTWEQVPGTEGHDVYWQSPTDRISWTYITEGEARRKAEQEAGPSVSDEELALAQSSPRMFGPVEYEAMGKKTTLAPSGAWGRVVPGALLKP